EIIFFFRIVGGLFSDRESILREAAVYDNDATFEGSDFGRKLGAIVFFIMIIEGGLPNSNIFRVR
ncbi:hypothetical protein AN414_21170, partial [Serratia marcescens]